MAAPLYVAGFRFASVHVSEPLPVDDAGVIRIIVPFGSARVWVGAGGTAQPTLALGAGEAAVIHPGSPATLWAHAPVLVGVLWLRPETFARHAFDAKGCEMALSEDFVSYDAFLRRVCNVLKAGARLDRPASNEYLELLAREISLHLATKYGESRKRSRIGGLSADRLSRSLALIETRIAESLRVEDLAEHANMSAFHYARMFKASTGHAPHFYITMRRIERAKELLAQTAMPLADISDALGYSTQAHFTGMFRTHAGATPRAYRMRSRKV